MQCTRFMLMTTHTRRRTSHLTTAGGQWTVDSSWSSSATCLLHVYPPSTENPSTASLLSLPACLVIFWGRRTTTFFCERGMERPFLVIYYFNNLWPVYIHSSSISHFRILSIIRILGSSLQGGSCWGIPLKKDECHLHLKTPRFAKVAKLVPVQYQENENGLLLGLWWYRTYITGVRSPYRLNRRKLLQDVFWPWSDQQTFTLAWKTRKEIRNVSVATIKLGR